jgi:hypothetical protein
VTDPSQRTGPPGERRRATLERDAALARVGRVRRWLIAATAALTAGIAALVYAVTPGRSAAATHVKSSAPAASSRSSGLQMPPAAGAGALGLQGPAQVPSAAPPQAVAPAPAPAAGGGAVSGGS